MSEKDSKGPSEGAIEGKYQETVKSSHKSLLISLDPKTSADKKLAFVQAMIGGAVQITHSVDEKGNFNDRFAAAISGGKDNKSNPDNLHLICFTEGKEDIEMAAVTTRAQIIATQLGVKITGIKRTDPPAVLSRAQESREKISGGRVLSGICSFGTEKYEVIVTVTNQMMRDCKLFDRAAFLLGINQMLKKFSLSFIENLAKNPKEIEAILRDPNRLHMCCRDTVFLSLIFNGNMNSVMECLQNQQLALDTVGQFLMQCWSGKLNLSKIIRKVDLQKITPEEIDATKVDAERNKAFQIVLSRQTQDTPLTSVSCAMRPLV